MSGAGLTSLQEKGLPGNSWVGKSDWLVIEADEGDNKIVFAKKCERFPPGFNELTERLRILEAKHPVDLDKTAQKILRQQQSRRSRPRKRR